MIVMSRARQDRFLGVRQRAARATNNVQRSIVVVDDDSRRKAASRHVFTAAGMGGHHAMDKTPQAEAQLTRVFPVGISTTASFVAGKHGIIR